MKYALALALATFLTATTATATLGFDAPKATATIETVDYVVGFRTLPADRSEYAGFRVVEENTAINFLVVRVTDPALFEAVAALDPNVVYFEVNEEQYRTNMVPNDTHYNGYQYSMKPSTTNVEAAWDKTLGNTGVKVCVVDTGQYRAHQDFVGTAWGEWRDFVNGKTSAYDDNGHGTHVTGTIAAKTNNAKGVAGIAQATLAGAKVLGKTGSGTTTAVANGITWCADIGAHVISASLGGGASSTLQNAVNYANSKGALQVYAAGNSGPCTNCVDYPARYTVAVAVSCTDSGNKLCSFSSTGPEVDFAAPGYDIPSTYPAGIRPCSRGDSNCYVLSSGTSMSTPHVSGLAALVKATHATYTKDDLYNAIKAGAKDLGAAGFDNSFGWGLMQGTSV